MKHPLLFGVVAVVMVLATVQGAAAESYTWARDDTNTSIVWAKMNLTSGVTTVTISDSGAYAAEPNNVFLLYDNFSEASVNTTKWDAGGSPSQSGGLLVLNADAEAVLSDTYFPIGSGIIAEARMDGVSGGYAQIELTTKASATVGAAVASPDNDTNIFLDVGGAENNNIYSNSRSGANTDTPAWVASGFATTDTLNYGLWLYGSTSNNTKSTFADVYTAATNFSGNFRLILYKHTAGTIQFDWARVRQKAANEPTVSCASNICTITSSTTLNNYQVPLATSYTTGDVNITTLPGEVNITFASKTPADITSTNLFTTPSYFRYNVTMAGLQRVYMNVTVNGSPTYINGVAQPAFSQHNSTSNSTVFYNFSIGENYAYPYVANFEEDAFEDASHGFLTLTSQNDYVLINFLGVNTSKNTNYFEIMAASSGVSEIYYCNSSYTTGNPSTSAFCTQFATLNTIAFNHTHPGGNSKHNVFSLPIVAGAISGVTVTSNSTFLVRGPVTGNTTVYRAIGLTDPRSRAGAYSTNNGVGWTDQSGYDSHLHQYSNGANTLFTYQGCAVNASTTECTSFATDNLDITLLAPTTPNVLTPPNGTTNYTRFVTITWMAATPQPGSTIASYNLSVLNEDETLNQTINGSVTNTSTSYSWNSYSTSLTPGTYRVRVAAKDSNNLTSFADGDTFNLTTNSLLNAYIRTYGNATITNTTDFNISRVGGGWSATYSVSNWTSIDLVKGYTYTITTAPPGYAVTTTNVTITANSTDLYIKHYTKNSISFSFYNEETLALVNTTTIYIDLISDAFSSNYTTTNGTLFVDLLTPESYSIRYGALGYANKFYSLTLVDNYHYDLNLSMLNETAASNLTMTVKDTLGNNVEGATIKVLKYDVTTNAFLLNTIVDTNFQGQAITMVALNSEYYKFIIEYGGAEIYSTAPTYIYANEITFYVPLNQADFGETYENVRLSGYITYNNATRTASFTYNDEYNVASQGCLKVYEYPDLTLTNTTCVARAAGTVTFVVDNSTGDSWLLKGYINVSGVHRLVATRQVSFTTTAETGGSGYLYAIILLLIIVFVGAWSLSVAVFLAGLAPLILGVTGLVSLPVYLTVPVFIGAVIVVYVLEAGK
jgi:hypothetical protein